MTTGDWDQLAKSYPIEAVQEMRRRIEDGEEFTIGPDDLAIDGAISPEEATALLEQLVANKLLERSIQFRCPCGDELTEFEASGTRCPHCDGDFSDIGLPTKSVVYVREGKRRRDVRRVLVLHGMNTRGAWQEELNWRVSLTYGRSVPVAIYKYGVVRPGAILRSSHRKLAQRLTDRIERLSGQIEESGFGGRPDIIAHSLGTLLLGRALRESDNLRVGRVIVLGSILRPDFPWDGLIASGRVEAVLCHYGTKDLWAAVAHYVIPDSGPSGRRGFNDRARVLHVAAKGFEHSDFFREDQLPILHQKVWTPFLSSPDADVPDHDTGPAPRWVQANWFFRATLLRLCILWALIGATALVGIIVALGVVRLVQFFTPHSGY